MKRTKKIVTLALAMVLVICTTVMATIAYLQSETDTVTNTFTVGNVAITLDEAKVDLYGNPLKQKVNDEGEKVVDEDGKPVYESCSREEADRVTENFYKLVPNHTYMKDPTVHVAANSEESYIRMIVTITNLENVKDAFGVADGEYFLPQYFVEGWDSTKWITTKVIAEDSNADTATYEFRYYTTVETLDGNVKNLEPLFTDIVVPENIDNTKLALLKDLEIKIVAHAIQADGFIDTVKDGEVIATAEDNAWAVFKPNTNTNQ